MDFHWQNLNDGKVPRWGGGRRHGRAWLRVFEKPGQAYRSGVQINWCWALMWDGSCAVAFSFVRQEGHGIHLRFALPWLFDLYLTFLGGPFAWLAKKALPEFSKDQRRSYPDQELPKKDYGDRELFNLYFYDWAFWWNFWRNPMGGWSSRDPKWQHGSFHLVDFLFGKTTYEARALAGPVEVKIPMPERAYDATVTVEERIWRRKRWPGVWRRWFGFDVDMKRDPIPFPGKGENSWDCGEDATYGLSAPTDRHHLNIEDAIAAVVRSTMNSRRRHGGSVDWRPTEDHRPKASPPGGDESAACAS